MTNQSLPVNYLSAIRGRFCNKQLSHPELLCYFSQLGCWGPTVWQEGEHGGAGSGKEKCQLKLVFEALAKGWVLYGDPAYAFDAANGQMRCAQAVVKEVEGEYSPELKLGRL